MLPCSTIQRTLGCLPPRLWSFDVGTMQSLRSYHAASLTTTWHAGWNATVRIISGQMSREAGCCEIWLGKVETWCGPQWCTSGFPSASPAQPIEPNPPNKASRVSPAEREGFYFASHQQEVETPGAGHPTKCRAVPSGLQLERKWEVVSLRGAALTFSYRL